MKTDAEELGSKKKRKLREIMELLARVSSVICLAKAKSTKNGTPVMGWTMRIHDFGYNGPMERTVVVFNSYLRINRKSHDAELVMTDANGTPILVLSCTRLEQVAVIGSRKHRSYKFVTEGATMVLAA